MRETSHLAAYQRWLRRRAGSSSRPTPTSGRGRWRRRARSGRRSGEYFGVRASAPYDAVLADRAMPGARWFPGAELSYAEHMFARQGRRARSALVHASELRPLGETSWGELRGRTAAFASGPARARRRPRRPRRRLPPEHRGGGGRVPRHARASARSGPRARRTSASRAVVRPLRADRAEGAARGRRLPLRRQGLRPARGGRADPRGDCRASSTRSTCPTSREPLDRGSVWEQLARERRRRRARVRAAAVRPPALGALLLGHDGAAEVDRPRAGRRAARVPEGAVPPLRPASRRPALLVHDHRVDDVEPRRRRAPHRRADRPLRRQRRVSRTWACCGISPPRPG